AQDRPARAVHAGAGDPVVGEGAVLDREGGAQDAGDPAAAADEAGGLVVGQGHVGQGQVGLLVEDAAAQGGCAGRACGRGAAGEAVGDGQVVDLDVGAAAADVEDAARVVAADGQLAGAGSLDVQVLVNDQFAAGQGDGVDGFGEDDLIAGVGGG